MVTHFANFRQIKTSFNSTSGEAVFQENYCSYATNQGDRVTQGEKRAEMKERMRREKKRRKQLT